MPTTLRRPVAQRPHNCGVQPSIVDPALAAPFTLDQQLEPFGRWIGEPLWVPPKDEHVVLAETMVRETRPFTSADARWEVALRKHRDRFTQVREIDLFEASIRLPKGRFLVSITEQKDFDEIEDKIPACVQTRLDEFLAGPGQKRGVKVYYFKPLCVESGDQLILTTRDDVLAAIEKVKRQVFDEYRRQAVYQRPTQALATAANAVLSLPRAIAHYYVNRRQREIDRLQAKLEFERRKRVLDAARTYQQHRTCPCSFDDMLALTSPLKRTEVIEQFCIEQELTNEERQRLLMFALGTVPWFVSMSLTVGYLASLGLGILPSVLVCDPAFVAEMPDNPGVLLKIGHFDEVAGVMHVEI